MCLKLQIVYVGPIQFVKCEQIIRNSACHTTAKLLVSREWNKYFTIHFYEKVSPLVILNHFVMFIQLLSAYLNY